METRAKKRQQNEKSKEMVRKIFNDNDNVFSMTMNCNYFRINARVL